MSAERIAEMLAESGLAREEMADVLEAIAPLEDLARDVPAPSTELAALLGPGHGTDPRPGALLGARRRAVAGAVVLALSGVGATGLSAAANTLPPPLQHRISQFSRHYLPFDLPEPSARRRVHGFPAWTPGSTPAPTGREDESSRSSQGRDASHPVPAPAAPPSPRTPASASAAEPYAEPSSSPSAATTSAAPSPMAQSYASGSPTPSDRPSDQSAKGEKGHHGQTPDPGKDRQGHRQGHRQAARQGPGPGREPRSRQGQRQRQGHPPDADPARRSDARTPRAGARPAA